MMYNHSTLIRIIQEFDRTCQFETNQSAERLNSQFALTRDITCLELGALTVSVPELNELSMTEVLAGNRFQVAISSNSRVAGTIDGATVVSLTEADLRAYERILKLPHQERVKRVIEAIESAQAETSNPTNDRIKRLMEEFGMPNNISLYQILYKASNGVLADLGINAWNIGKAKKLTYLLSEDHRTPERVEAMRIEIREIINDHVAISMGEMDVIIRDLMKKLFDVDLSA